MHDEVLSFWFDEIDSSRWWKKDPEFDQLIVDRFSVLHEQASRGELFEWRQSPEGRLAEVIVLDQFSRNMFRDTARSFAYDPLALVLSQEAIAQGADDDLSTAQRPFLYMPLMHSESLIVHDVALDLFARKCSEGNLNFEVRHRDIIERFGRYPHRNEILGRASTAEEIEFLKGPGSGF
jgi:uncharacterized protein (DUF924 family)